MLKLFIDTSSDYLSLVLTFNEEVISSLRLLAGRKISEELLVQIERLMIACGIDISNIGEFYAVTGPGSFTGVRIGVAMAMGLAAGASKPCYGITSLDAAALASGNDVCKTASRLKGDVFAVREYDFSRGEFSPYLCRDIKNPEAEGYINVNGGNGSFVRLEEAVSGGRYMEFRGECAPLYLRKSEAELNLDKRSLDNRP